MRASAPSSPRRSARRGLFALARPIASTRSASLAVGRAGRREGLFRELTVRPLLHRSRTGDGDALAGRGLRPSDRQPASARRARERRLFPVQRFLHYCRQGKLRSATARRSLRPSRLCERDRDTACNVSSPKDDLTVRQREVELPVVASYVGLHACGEASDSASRVILCAQIFSSPFSVASPLRHRSKISRRSTAKRGRRCTSSEAQPQLCDVRGTLVGWRTTFSTS